MEESVHSNRLGGKELVATVQLLFANLFMGITYVAQRYAMSVRQPVQPLTYNTYRFLLSTLILAFARPWLQSAFHTEVEKFDMSRFYEYLRSLWFWAGFCGLAAVGGSAFQQYGLRTLSAGKTSFITGMYVILVPIVEWCIPGLGNRLQLRTWIGAGVSIVGVYFLSGCGEDTGDCYGFGGTDPGEICVFVSTVFWVACIIIADTGLKKVDSVSFTLVQFIIITTCTLPLALLLEPSEWQYPFINVTSSMSIIIFAGITETIGVMLGMLGQMYVPPSKAALIFSLEALASALLGYILLGETLTPLELFGCALMILANVIAFLAPNNLNCMTLICDCSRQSRAGEYVHIVPVDDNSSTNYHTSTGKTNNLGSNRKFEVVMAPSMVP
jgi:drug/metabolite transporter (DMT)-like permease